MSPSLVTQLCPVFSLMADTTRGVGPSPLSFVGKTKRTNVSQPMPSAHLLNRSQAWPPARVGEDEKPALDQTLQNSVSKSTKTEEVPVLSPVSTASRNQKTLPRLAKTRRDTSEDPKSFQFYTAYPVGTDWFGFVEDKKPDQNEPLPNSAGPPAEDRT